MILQEKQAVESTGMEICISAVNKTICKQIKTNKELVFKIYMFQNRVIT